MKKIAIGVVAIVVVIGVAATWLLNSLDGIVKNQIEAIGSELTGVPVTVTSVNIDIGKGIGTIAGLKIANPDGYNTDAALNLNMLRLDLDLSSLAGSPLVLEKLVIDSLEGNLELREGSTNLSEIVANIQSDNGEAEKKTDETESGEPLKLSINELLISNAKITVTDKDVTEVKTIPTISLADVGGKNGGTPAQVSGVIVSTLISEILKEAAAQRLMKTVGDSVDEMAKGLLNSLNKALE